MTVYSDITLVFGAVTWLKMAAIFLAPPSSPSLRHSIATIFVYLVLNFMINTAQYVRRDSTYLFRPERSKFQVSVPVQAQVPIVKQHVQKKKFRNLKRQELENRSFFENFICLLMILPYLQ